MLINCCRSLSLSKRPAIAGSGAFDKLRLRSNRLRLRTDTLRLRTDTLRLRTDTLRLRTDTLRLRTDRRLVSLPNHRHPKQPAQAPNRQAVGEPVEPQAPSSYFSILCRSPPKFLKL
jgi:hypothetical protein